jgi:hypothetical protein
MTACASIGLGGRRKVDLAFSGLKVLDIYRLTQIASTCRLIGRLADRMSWSCWKTGAESALRTGIPRLANENGGRSRPNIISHSQSPACRG